MKKAIDGYAILITIPSADKTEEFVLGQRMDEDQYFGAFVTFRKTCNEQGKFEYTEGEFESFIEAALYNLHQRVGGVLSEEHKADIEKKVRSLQQSGCNFMTSMELSKTIFPYEALQEFTQEELPVAELYLLEQQILNPTVRKMLKSGYRL